MDKVKYKISQLAKDMGMTGKALVELMKQKGDPNKKYTTTTMLSGEELDLAYEIVTIEHSVDSFDDFLSQAKRMEVSEVSVEEMEAAKKKKAEAPAVPTEEKAPKAKPAAEKQSVRPTPVKTAAKQTVTPKPSEEHKEEKKAKKAEVKAVEPEKAGTAEKPEKQEKAESAEKTAVKVEKAEKTDAKAEKVEKAEKVVKPEKPEHAERPRSSPPHRSRRLLPRYRSAAPPWSSVRFRLSRSSPSASRRATTAARSSPVPPRRTIATAECRPLRKSADVTERTEIVSPPYASPHRAARQRRPRTA